VEFHLTDFVMSCTLPSANVPVAVNCCEIPGAITDWAGVTMMDTSGAGVTVSMADPETDPDAAVIVVVPVAALTALPLEPIVATAGAEDAHATELVSTRVLPSV
jgi:hypothetical protein